VSILSQLLNEVEKITQEQIEQANLCLTGVEKGEQVIHVVKSQMARRLWALAHRYQHLHHRAFMQANFEATEQAVRDEYHSIGSRASMMEDLVRSLAWAEMRNEVDPGTWIGEIGLRADFTLVKRPEQDRAAMLQEFTKPLREALHGLVEQLQADRADRAEEEALPRKKRKPQ